MLFTLYQIAHLSSNSDTFQHVPCSPSGLEASREAPSKYNKASLCEAPSAPKYLFHQSVTKLRTFHLWTLFLSLRADFLMKWEGRQTVLGSVPPRGEHPALACLRVALSMSVSG